MQEDAYLQQRCQAEWACQAVEEASALLQLLFLVLQKFPAAATAEQLHRALLLLRKHGFSVCEVSRTGRRANATAGMSSRPSE